MQAATVNHVLDTVHHYSQFFKYLYSKTAAPSNQMAAINYGTFNLSDTHIAVPIVSELKKLTIY